MAYFPNLKDNLIPGVDDGYSIGSPTQRWRDGYFGNHSLHVVTTAGETGVATDWNMSANSDGYLTFSNVNDGYLVVTRFGNVGIGTTHPTQKLQVDGYVRANPGFMFGDGSIMTSASTGSGSGMSIGGSISGGTATRVLYEGAGPALADAATFTFDGNQLALSGTSAQLLLGGTTNQAGKILFKRPDGTTSGAVGFTSGSSELFVVSAANTAGLKIEATGSGVGNEITFFNGGSSAERGRLANGGDWVLGGTAVIDSSASGRLHLLAALPQLILGDNSGSNAGQMSFRRPDGTRAGTVGYASGSSELFLIQSASGAGLKIQASGSGVGNEMYFFSGATERARFADGGNFTIGSTTATSMFNVGSAAEFQVTSGGAISTSSTATVTGATFANGGVDRSTAAPLTLGGTNASAVNIAQSSVQTSALGALAVGTSTIPSSQKLYVEASNTGTNTVSFAQTNSAGISSLVMINDNSDGAKLILKGSTASGTSYGISNNSLVLLVASSGAPMVVGNDNAQPLVFGTNSTERIRILSTGQVGIGTAIPLLKLDVVTGAGDGVVIHGFGGGSNGDPGLYLYDARGTAASPSAIQSADRIGSVNYSGYGATTFGSPPVSLTAQATENFSDSAHGTKFTIGTTANGSTSQFPRFLIDQTGFAEFGNDLTTSTPNEQLTIDGRLSLLETTAPSATTSYGKIYVKSSDSNLYFKTGGGTEYQLTPDSSASANKSLSNLTTTAINTALLPATDATLALGSPALRWKDGYFGPNSLHVATTAGETGIATDWNWSVNSDGYTEFRNINTGYLSITRFGNVGIGTTHPTQKLQVDGYVRANPGFIFGDGSIMTSASTGSGSGANTSLSNLITTAINTSLHFIKEFDYTIDINSSTSAATAGGSLTIKSAVGTDGTATGALNISTPVGVAGSGSTPGGNGGGIFLNNFPFGNGGDGGTTSAGGDGGTTIVYAGNGGIAGLVSGNAGNGATLDLQCGWGGDAASGTGTAGTGGQTNLGSGYGGNASATGDAGNAGALLLFSGGGGAGNGTHGGGNGGAIQMNEGYGNGGAGGTSGPGGVGGTTNLYAGDGGVAGSTTGAAGDGGIFASGSGFGGNAAGGTGAGGAGGFTDIHSGRGGHASSTGAAGNGGSANFASGKGGNGSATKVAGTGGDAIVQGGDGGTDGGAGGASGGNLRLVGGLASGTATSGTVFIGDTSTSAVTIGASTIATTITGQTVISGSFTAVITTKTSNYTLTDNDNKILVDATSGVVTITLPLASTCSGREYKIKKSDSSTNNMVINTTGGNSIDGDSAIVSNVQYRAYTVTSNGTNWFII